MNVENNLHLDIILKNITTNETFKFEDYDLEKITHAPSKFSIKDQYGKTPILIIFAVGFSAMAYIYESPKSLMPKQKKLKEQEYQYLVAEYLGLQLEQTACKILKLDSIEFEN